MLLVSYHSPLEFGHFYEFSKLLLCQLQLSDNWQYGEYYDEDERLHPSLLEFVNLRTKVFIVY